MRLLNEMGNPRPRFFAMALLLALALSSIASAADIKPSSMPVGQWRSMLGEWVLTVDTPEEDMHLLLTFHDIDGKLGATLRSASQTEPHVITNISESSLALKLRYGGVIGETETAMVLIVRTLDGGTLTGSMADDAGEIAGADETDAAKTRGLGLFNARVRGVRGGKVPGRALMNLNGKEIKITYGNLRASAKEAKALETLKPGEVFQFGNTRATKIFAGGDLLFGSTLIKAENAGPNYPGVYSLWLKKSEDGWNLLFNSHADIWGSMHDPEMDVAEIPLESSTSDKEESKFLIDLDQDGDEGVIRIAFGKDVWRTRFVVAQ